MGKMQKEKCIHIYVLDGLKNIIYGGKVSDIKVNEAYIIAKSKALYQNDAPCIIIRTKIINQVYEMLRELISNMVSEANRKEISIEDIPREFNEALDLRDGKYLLAEVI